MFRYLEVRVGYPKKTRGVTRVEPGGFSGFQKNPGVFSPGVLEIPGVWGRYPGVWAGDPGVWEVPRGFGQVPRGLRGSLISAAGAFLNYCWIQFPKKIVF